MSVLADERYADDDGRIIPGSLAHLGNDEPVSLSGVRHCKRPDCQYASLGIKRGPYSGLCRKHTEQARAERSRTATKQTPQVDTPTAEIVAVPAPEPIPRDTPQGQSDAAVLVDLARTVAAADAEYADLRDQLDELFGPADESAVISAHRSES